MDGELNMVAHEFYLRDPVEGYQHIGTPPERRMNPARVTEESGYELGKRDFRRRHRF